MVMQRQRQRRRHHHIMRSFVCSIDAATLARSTLLGCSLSMITSIWFVSIGTSIASLSDVASSLLSMVVIFLIYAGVTDGGAQVFELPATRARAPPDPPAMLLLRVHSQVADRLKSLLGAP